MEINWQQKYQNELARTRQLAKICHDLTKEISSLQEGNRGYVIARIIPYSTTDYWTFEGGWGELSDACVYPEPLDDGFFMPEYGCWVALP